MNNTRELHKTADGIELWLDKNIYLDRTIIETGNFEKDSTELVKSIVKEGWSIIDVGANIGYYTTLFSKLVGNTGKVYAFEPTKYYSEILINNLEANKSTNASVHNFGLSDEDLELEINIGESSATLHWVADSEARAKEIIKLTTLDKFSQENDLEKVDFVKVDIDGHEPKFFLGAKETLEKFKPQILFEVSKEHYVKAGFELMYFYEEVLPKFYSVYTEDMRLLPDLNSFMNYADLDGMSVNILLKV